jgi:hypothetical protein
MRIIMRPVETLVWMEPDGNFRPLRFRLEAEDGELMVIRVEQILSRTEERLAGNPMVIYGCQGEVRGRMRRFELKYEIRACKWYLYKI